MAGISCNGRSQRDLALAKETLTLPKRLWLCQRDFDLAKETLLLTSGFNEELFSSCSWQRDHAPGKETVLLPKRLSPCRRNFDFAKETLTLPKKLCSWPMEDRTDRQTVMEVTALLELLLRSYKYSNMKYFKTVAISLFNWFIPLYIHSWLDIILPQNKRWS